MIEFVSAIRHKKKDSQKTAVIPELTLHRRQQMFPHTIALSTVQETIQTTMAIINMVRKRTVTHTDTTNGNNTARITAVMVNGADITE